MYCPNCGQQQISAEVRFCSRCGLALSGLAEWIAGDRQPARVTHSEPLAPLSPRRKGIRRGAQLMFISGVLFVVCLALSALFREGAVMLIPCAVFFVSVVIMLYARLFSDPTPPVTFPVIHTPVAQGSPIGASATRGSLTPANNIYAPPIDRQQVRTNELAQLPSVTENTTRLLDES